MPNLNTARLTWDWSQGGGGTLDRFDLFVGTASGVYSCAAVALSATSTGYDVDNAVSTPGQYYFRVAAVNTGTTGVNSNEANGEMWVGLKLIIT